MVDVFQEVDEELRREKLEKFWKKFGPFIIGAVVLFIGGMAGKVFYTQYQNSQRIAESEVYQEAVRDLDAGDLEGALQRFDQLAETGKYGYEMLAQFQKASELTNKGDVEEALALYESISGDSNYSQVYRDYAALNAAMIVLDRGELDEAAERLQPLMAEDNAWTYSARELMGLIHIEKGEWQAAEDLFLDLSLAREAPSDLKGRASEFLEIIASSKPAGETLTGGGEEPLAEPEESVADGDGR